MEYIATFFSHYGAIHFTREHPEGLTNIRPMPVPRDLSSSCGTAVKFDGPSDFAFDYDATDEIEQIVRIVPSGYEAIYRAK